MRNIQSVNVWKNGTVKTATRLKVRTVFDNLENLATFFYQLLEIVTLDEGYAEVPVVDGNVDMNPVDYTSWDRSINGTYGYVANELNLTILP